MTVAKPSPEEVLRVNRWECRRRGRHSWNEIHVNGEEDPVALICDHCGRRCTVKVDNER